MAVQKFLSMVAGAWSEVTALVTSAGAGDAGKVVALGTDGKLDSSVMPTGIAADVKVLPASEALSAGQLVNIYDSGAGVEKCRKADCSNGRRAHGFVLAPVNQDANATVYLPGNTITGLTTKTPGAPQFLSPAGAMSETAPSTAGYICQEIGNAESATEVAFNPMKPVTLA